jgi:hypothetical protein
MEKAKKIFSVGISSPQKRISGASLLFSIFQGKKSVARDDAKKMEKKK